MMCNRRRMMLFGAMFVALTAHVQAGDDDGGGSGGNSGSGGGGSSGGSGGTGGGGSDDGGNDDNDNDSDDDSGDDNSGSGGGGSGHHGSGKDHDRARDAVAKGKAVSLAKLKAYLQEKYPGKVLKVDLAKRFGNYVYKVRVLQAGNRLKSVTLDARTLQQKVF